MKTLLALAVVLGAANLVGHSSGSSRTARAAWTCPRTAVLTALPAIGTVEWRSRYWSHQSRFSLGIHLFDTASTWVRFRAGQFSRDRNVQPGEPAVWFRYSTNRVQWLAAVSGGEGGDVVGVVRADFRTATARRVRSQDCWMFYPPHLTVHFYGHQPNGYVPPHGGFGGMLRPIR
ncbi:MAG TPA: hypothetical protein VIR14_06835 [Gaiellaceae bacterium]